MDEAERLRKHLGAILPEKAGDDTDESVSIDEIKKLEEQSKALAEDLDRLEHRRAKEAGSRIQGVDYSAKKEMLSKVFDPDNVHSAHPDSYQPPRPKVDASWTAKLAVVDKNARVEVLVSDDTMTAKGILYPPEGAGIPVSAVMITQALKNANVVFGIKTETFQTIVARAQKEKALITDVILAEGEPPEHGRSGSIEYCVEFKSNRKRTGYKDTEKIPPEEDYRYALVRKGDVLAQVNPGFTGRAGKNVRGEEIPCSIVEEFKFINKGNVTVRDGENTIKEYVSIADGEAVLFPGHIEVRRYLDGEFSISLTPDRMSAMLDIWPPLGTGAFVDKTAILAKMDEMKIIFGVIDGNIEAAMKMHATREQVKSMQIAKGKSAVNGKDGRIEIVLKKKVIDDELRVVHKDLLSDLVAVTQGEHIASLYPPTFPETDGTTVTGEVIKAELGRTIAVIAGKNVTAEHDNRTDIISYVAQAAGQVTITPDAISVSPLYSVQNVDMSTGNIHFTGDVAVSGNIEDDFIVEAEGTITVKGNIGGAKVTAGQNVIVGNGIITKDIGFVRAGGDVAARFIERSTVEAKGDVKVVRAIINSSIIAGKSIDVSGEKGKSTIIGGVVRSRSGVHALNIGNAAGVRTHILTGLDFFQQKNLDLLAEEHSRYSRYLYEIQQLIGRVLASYPDITAIPPKIRGIYADALKKQNQLRTLINRVKLEEADIIEKMDNSTEASITVDENLFPDVYVAIGHTKMRIADKRSKVTLIFNSDEKRIDYRL
ncbi:MAG: FapA family protein [Spirochaetota bacterium]